jgi:hypothetical protein
MAGALFDRMFVLLPAQATTNYSVRGLLPQLIQDIVMVQAFSEAQKSNLLASFYPGCVTIFRVSARSPGLAGVAAGLPKASAASRPS